MTGAQGTESAGGRDVPATAGAVAPYLTSEQHARWWKETGRSELRQILLWRWDPIGVSDVFPDAATEYHSYAGTVVTRARAGASRVEIAAVLLGFEERQMGGRLSADEHLESVGSLIARWYPASMANWLRLSA